MGGGKTIVIGGGAAGLMAAGQAAETGGKVVLLEKKAQPGRKLRITGKGRCNLTNIAPLDDFLTHFGKNGKFLRQAFSRFFSEDLAVFLGGIGVDVQSERGGRVFPADEDAGQVVEALTRWVRDCGVNIKINSAVDRLIVEDGRVTGVAVSGWDYPARAVIIATGGASYPATGSTGDGYRLAQEVGHKIVPIRPALVPLTTSGNTARRLQGLSLRNVTSRLLIDDKAKSRLMGEMLFTHYGLSGPIILTQSGMAVDALERKQAVTVSIDLKPALDEKKLDARLLRDFSEHGKKKYSSILKGLLPRKLISVCADLTGINPETPGHQITSGERRRLRLWLKDFRFEIVGHRSFSEAIITAGGVELKEIDPRRMASRKIHGLYFAGEVLNLNGDTGGYNLQAAFSTGWLAGRSAAEA
ncbi:MAG: NAD(P)/FAD-dependent oxidoreductase [FCB group bacterium]|nr:NAD(P)/FAD-dependent oxidoreductase [FCB group bacterium]